MFCSGVRGSSWNSTPLWADGSRLRLQQVHQGDSFQARDSPACRLLLPAALQKREKCETCCAESDSIDNTGPKFPEGEVSKDKAGVQHAASQVDHHLVPEAGAPLAHLLDRSLGNVESRQVGQGIVNNCPTRWSPYCHCHCQAGQSPSVPSLPPLLWLSRLVASNATRPQ